MCVCFAPELVHVWIYNMEDTWVLPLSLLCALGDPHIVLFVIIHLVDFLCYVTSFFLWKTELYTWTCWMQHMRWEAIINKTIHLCLFFFFFFLQQTIICLTEVCVHQSWVWRHPCCSLLLFALATIIPKSLRVNDRPGLWHWHATDVSPSHGY